MGRRTSKILVVCQLEGCGKEFYTNPSNIERGGGRYHSRECYNKARTGIIRGPYDWGKPTGEKKCPVCEGPIPYGWGTGNTEEKVFCSDECKNRGRYRHGTESKQLEPTQASYLAGFVDGEGSIFLYMRKDAVALRLGVSNTKRPVLDWFQEITGIGAIVTSEHANPKHSTSYWWQINSDSAESVIKQIRPYLKVKNVQADLALETQERLRDPSLKSDHTWQLEYCHRMRALNRRGN